MLFLLGVMEGLIGCFQFSHAIGPVPVAALAFCVVILATCLLARPGDGLPAWARLVPAFGWFLASFVLTMPTAAGSVIVTNTTAGKWYLYGGAACAGLGVVLTFVLSRRRGRWPRRGGRMAAVDQADFRRAAGQFASGIVVVSTSLDGAGHAMTVTAFTSVSLEPLLVLFCAEKIARFHDAVLAAGTWAVIVLGEDAEKTARWLATRGRPLDGQLDAMRTIPAR